MGHIAELEKRYADVFKAVEDDDERCCGHPTCWVGILWDLMQTMALVQLKDHYIQTLEASNSIARKG
jgi:hypothetical protein